MSTVSVGTLVRVPTCFWNEGKPLPVAGPSHYFGIVNKLESGPDWRYQREPSVAYALVTNKSAGSPPFCAQYRPRPGYRWHRVADCETGPTVIAAYIAQLMGVDAHQGTDAVVAG